MNKKPLMIMAAIGAAALLTTGCDRDEPEPECNNRAGSVNCAIQSDGATIIPSPDGSPVNGTIWDEDGNCVRFCGTAPGDVSRPSPSFTPFVLGLVYDENGDCLRFCGTTPDRTPAA